jgi:hypothetical protein
LFKEDALFKAFNHLARSAERKGHAAYIPDERPIDGRGFCIAVKEAGNDEVNGVYKRNRSRTIDGVPYYHLEGRIFKTVTFKLYRKKARDGTRKWWLRAFPKDDNRGPGWYCYDASLDTVDPDKAPGIAGSEGERGRTLQHHCHHRVCSRSSIDDALSYCWLAES